MGFGPIALCVVLYQNPLTVLRPPCYLPASFWGAKPTTHREQGGCQVTMKKKPERKSKQKPRKTSRKPKPAARKKTTAKTPNKKAVGRKVSATKRAPRKATRSVAPPTRKTSQPTKAPRKPARVKVSFSRKEKSRFAHLLTSLREGVQEQIQFLASNSLNTEKYDIPRDNGTDDFDRDSALSILSTEQNALFEISEAERRLKQGAYGVCEECNVPIGMNRLEALPFARMCVQCQQKIEERRPRFQPLGSTLNLTGESRSTGEGRTAADDQAE